MRPPKTLERMPGVMARLKEIQGTMSREKVGVIWGTFCYEGKKINEVIAGGRYRVKGSSHVFLSFVSGREFSMLMNRWE